MTEMPYLCWAFLYTSTGVNSYDKQRLWRKCGSHCYIIFTKGKQYQHLRGRKHFISWHSLMME
ncbi:hypothetical protein B379_07800 [Anoxybacillus ayderensis G10]|nr:hypothetical protein B379_07800 [Anoxybacillus ayderensis G10]